MKKTILSLAALMLMAAPVMTSCSNDLDEVAPAEETKGNVVTLTIALPDDEPATRVAVDGSTLKITGWENGDVVTLYKANPGQMSDYDREIWEDVPASLDGEGVVFTYSSTIQEFSGTLPTGKTLADYNLAVYGGTAENMAGDQGGININPTTWCSTDLKDVVMMGAIKDSEGNFTMKVINNVMKIDNQSGADVTVAWYGYDYYPEKNLYFKLASQVATTNEKPMVWKGAYINDQDHTDASAVPTFTLVNDAVNYVNFPMVDSWYTFDKIGLYKTDGTATTDATAVVTMKLVNNVRSGSNVYAGKLIKFNTPYTGTAY